jgi:DNA primase
MKLPGAVQYLLSRGLTMETIKKYKLGYTDGMVLNLMYAWERELADEIGIMTRNGFEVMSHRVVVPNLIDKNQADFISGRTILNDKVKYLHARMPKPLIGFYEVRKSPIIFTVEGHFDWLTLMQWGYPAVCIAGSSTKSYSLLPLQEKEVVIIPDLDDGEGMKAANSIKSQLGDRAVILDYSALKTDANKLDISALAEREDGEESFRQVIVQELPWLTRISNIERWFPQLI